MPQVECLSGGGLIEVPKHVGDLSGVRIYKFNSMNFMSAIAVKKYNNVDISYSIALNGEGILSSFENVLRLIFQDLTNSELLANEGSYYLNS